MDKTVVELLTPEKFVHYWPMIERELKTVPHVWEDYWTLESIYNYTYTGKFQCWAIGDANSMRIVCWTQIVWYPVGNILQVFLAIGTGIDEYSDDLVAWGEKIARDQGCVLIDVVGRPGWGPKLRKFGFKARTQSFSMKI